MIMMVKTMHLYRYTKQMPYVEIGQGKGAICIRPLPRKFFEKEVGVGGLRCHTWSHLRSRSPWARHASCASRLTPCR